MTTRDELANALARRYAVAGKAEKSLILDEFEAITGTHHKHAIRLLRSGPSCRAAEGRAGRRINDEAVCEALVVVWEASDRTCGKRLKALMPTFVEAMERHGHLKLGPEIRAGLRRRVRHHRVRPTGHHRDPRLPPKPLPVQGRQPRPCESGDLAQGHRVRPRGATTGIAGRDLHPASSRDGLSPGSSRGDEAADEPIAANRLALYDEDRQS